MKAVVCLPTRNEEASIHQMISEIKATKLDLFISDQQSTDKTQEIAVLALTNKIIKLADANVEAKIAATPP